MSLASLFKEATVFKVRLRPEMICTRSTGLQAMWGQKTPLPIAPEKGPHFPCGALYPKDPVILKILRSY